MISMSAELLTHVVSTVETRSRAQSLAHPMSYAYICLNIGKKIIRIDGNVLGRWVTAEPGSGASVSNASI